MCLILKWSLKYYLGASNNYGEERNRGKEFTLSYLSNDEHEVFFSTCMAQSGYGQYACPVRQHYQYTYSLILLPSPRKKPRDDPEMPVFTMPLLWQTDKELAIGMLTAMIHLHEVVLHLWIHPSIIVHIRRCHHPQRQSYHTYLRPVYGLQLFFHRFRLATKTADVFMVTTTS